jgi:hypothetical protein
MERIGQLTCKDIFPNYEYMDNKKDQSKSK